MVILRETTVCIEVRKPALRRIYIAYWFEEYVIIEQAPPGYSSSLAGGIQLQLFRDRLLHCFGLTLQRWVRLSISCIKALKKTAMANTIKAMPNHPQAQKIIDLMAESNSLRQEKRHEEALRRLEEAISIDPKFLPGVRGKGDRSVRIGPI